MIQGLSELARENLPYVRGQLREAGGGVIFLAIVITVGVVIITGDARYKPCTGYGWAVGGALGLLNVLLRPASPVRLGAKFGNLPKRASPYEMAMKEVIVRFRSRALLLLVAVSTVLAGLVIFIGPPSSLSPAGLVRCSTDGVFLMSMFFGFVHVGCLVTGVDWLYVWWKVRDISTTGP